MKLTKFFACCSLALASALACSAEEQPMAAYLFAYFTGNSPDQEQISYAISKDGFNYTPMNCGEPVISSDSIAVKKCVRDPHILRGEDGMFYMVATDMRSNDGWQSNHGLVLLKSSDLINWEHHAIDFKVRYPGTRWANAHYVWAPQTIWDEAAGKYMIYFAFGDGANPAYQVPHYVYANADFTDLEGEPQVLFDVKAAAIDMDIVFNEKTDSFHCFYKDEAVTHGITQAIFAKDDLHNPDKWVFTNTKISRNHAAEGSGCFRLFDGSWCLMWDAYANGYYSFNVSDDLHTFTEVAQTQTKGAFTPRHGTVIQISQAELDALEKAFPYVRYAEVPAEPMLLMQQGSNLHLEKGGKDSDQALLRSMEDMPYGENMAMQFIRCEADTNYYNVAMVEDETLYYLQQRGENVWSTGFLAENKDEDAAMWSIEEAGDGFVKLRNKKTDGFLGSDKTTSGEWVFCDKNGKNTMHHFYFEAPKTNAITDIESDATAAKEYYTIDGVRLGEPRPGLIIVKQGSSVKKEIIR